MRLGATSATLLLALVLAPQNLRADPAPAPGDTSGKGDNKMTAGAAAHEATLGDKELKAGNAKKAMRHYKRALELDGSSADIYTKRATGYMVTGQSDKARRDLDKALSLAPGNLKALLKRARVRRSLGLFDDAVADYEEARKIDPENKKVAKELPMVAQAVKAQEQGRKTYEQAMAALDAGDETGAKRLFQQAHYNLGLALKAAPDAPSSLEMDAKAMLHTGLYADVIQTTGRLLKVKPSSLEGYLYRGQAYLYQGEQDVALQHFKEGYKSDPDHKGLKKAYKDLKAYKKAEGKANDARDRNQWQDAAAHALSAIETLHGPGGDGKPELDTVTVKLREVLCKAYAKMGGKHTEAMRCADRVLSHDNDSIEAYKWKCEALMQLQQWDAALQSCDNAVRRAGREQEAQQLHQKAKRLKHKSEQKDYYGVLGLPNVPKGQPGAATEKQIKKAYHKLSMKHHPDKANGEEAKKEAEQKFVEIAEAYEILSDDDKRGKYDRGEEIEPEKNGGGGHNPFQHFHQHFHFQH